MRVERRRITMQNAKHRRLPSDMEKCRGGHREMKEDHGVKRASARGNFKRDETKSASEAKESNRRKYGETECYKCGGAGHFARGCKHQRTYSRRNSAEGSDFIVNTNEKNVVSNHRHRTEAQRGIKSANLWRQGRCK